jgi:hypothetical protein
MKLKAAARMHTADLQASPIILAALLQHNVVKTSSCVSVACYLHKRLPDSSKLCANFREFSLIFAIILSPIAERNMLRPRI